MTQVFSLPALLEREARVRGAKVALRFGSRTTTYSELQRNAVKVAHGLRVAGCKPGDRIAYVGKNSDHYFELLFGSVMIGAVMTPINWRLAPQEIEWIARDSGISALFFQSEFASCVQPLRTGLACLRLGIPLDIDPCGHDYVAWRDGLAREADRESKDVAISPDDVAVQMYTSGTTGRPKGVMLTHRNLLAFRSLPPQAQPEWNRWTEDDVSLIAMPIFHIGGTGFGLQTLCAGATGIITREFDAQEVLGLVENDRLSKMFVVPTALQMLVCHPRARAIDYRRIRTILYGASPIPAELLRQAMQVFGCGFVQQYGMTEATGTICALTPEDHENAGKERLRSAGRALTGVEIAIADSTGMPLAVGSIGEVLIRSPTNMAGYWNQPEATTETLKDGWLRSGDVGYLDEEGYLFIYDRIKDMIVSGGENVYPAEVEAAIQGHPEVCEVAVIGIPSDKWGEEVKAIVVLKPGSVIAAEHLCSWTRARIAAYKVPKTIDFATSLPRNAAGKILRREVREPFWIGRERRIN